MGGRAADSGRGGHALFEASIMTINLELIEGVSPILAALAVVAVVMAVKWVIDIWP